MTNTSADVTAGLAASLSDVLSEAWRPAFTTTPRDAFIPDRALWLREDGDAVAIDRNADPAGWLRAVGSNTPIITQLDDGADGDGSYTSSCSKPSIVLAMLDQLAVEPGMSVLEIGTGTGYNAALLACRLGPDFVTSIEIDPEIAATARTNLAKLDRAATVITGDGVAGYPPRAPFDRVIATASAATVPYQWIEQTRTGGVIVTPWGPPMANDHLMRLDVGENQATGTIVGSAGFMRLRSQRLRTTDEPDDFPDIATETSTDLDPRAVLGNHARLAVALYLGDCRAVFETDSSGETLWLLAADAWASVHAGTVRQAGARHLWDEAQAAYSWWLGQGRPARPRFHLTITQHEQWVCLDHPEHRIPSTVH